MRSLGFRRKAALCHKKISLVIAVKIQTLETTMIWSQVSFPIVFTIRSKA